MLTFISTAIVIAGIWSLLYFRASLWIWTAVAWSTMGFWAWADLSSPILQGFAWVLLIGVSIPLNIYPLRRQLITNKIFSLFKKILPPMSDTEREALEAGTVWWDGQLFNGDPDWNTLLDYKTPKLTDEEQAFIDGPVEKLCVMLNDWEITHINHDLPPEVWKFIRENGFFGMIIPKSWGGLGFSALAHSSVVMKISSRSVTAAVTVMVPNSLGPAELLLNYGTDDQKSQYLPRLARGDEIPCFALTGPEAGSDASSMPDRGIVCRAEFEGKKDVLGIRLNWDKRYITLGPIATLLGLAFKLFDPDHLIGDKESLGITVALIPTDTPGITIGRRHFPVNIPFQNGPNQGKDVFIPMDWLIGGQKMVGQGWRMLMECLATGRAISLPALSTGAGKLASRATGAYARIRRQFKTPIGRFEGVEEPLAQIAASTYMLDAVRVMTAGAVDAGESPSVISAIAKYHMTETMRKIINDAMDIQGGSAICMGPRNYLARSYQAIPISITVEGANILTRSLIIFGQGAMRCHPYVLKEIQATKESNTEKGRKEFDLALFAHAGFTISNMARTLFLGLSSAILVKKPVQDKTSRYFQQLTRMSAAFAMASDMSMLTLGGALKRKEKLSGRLADVLSHLYLASATLKRFHSQGSPQDDLALVQWVCENSLFRIQEALMGLFRNYPVRSLAHFMRIMVFPFGQTYRKPSDALGHQVASMLLCPSESRDRLTVGIFLPTDITQVTGRLDSALQKVVAASPVEHKLRKARKTGTLAVEPEATLIDRAIEAEVISSAEAELLRSANTARRDVIMVDDFPADLGLNTKTAPVSPVNKEKTEEPNKDDDDPDGNDNDRQNIHPIRKNTGR